MVQKSIIVFPRFKKSPYKIKTWFGSSVSGFEPSIITPQINGYFSEWWTPNWFDW